jgi:YfiR/HmsC-like
MEDLDPVTRSRRGHLIAIRCVVVAVVTAVVPTQPGAAQSRSLAATDLKAAYLFNFARFAEWPPEAVPAATALTLCIVNDEAVADAVDLTVKGRNVDDHGLIVRRLKAGAPLPTCHVLYLAGVDLKRSLGLIETIKDAVVLTVSDTSHFAERGGMVELFVESGHMRFAVNTDALQRGRIRLSSRLLQLAKIVRDAKPD